MSGVRQLLSKDNGGWSYNISDWLTLDISTVGCRLSSVNVKCSRTRSMVLGSRPMCGIVDAY